MKPPLTARRACSIAARAAVLLGTTWLLVADSPDDGWPTCEPSSPPAVFTVDGDCGPAGIVVLEPINGGRIFVVHNPAPLGLERASQLLGQFSGSACPLDLMSETWAITGTVCPDVAGPRDGGAPGEAPLPTDARPADARTIVVSGTDGPAETDARTVVVSGTDAADARTVVVSGTDALPSLPPGDAACGTRRCVPTRVGDELQLTCTNGAGALVCRARLRRMP